MVDGFVIRAMEAADHSAVADIGFTAWCSSDAWVGKDIEVDTAERVRRAYDEFSKTAGGRITVCEMDGKIVRWTAPGRST